MRRCGGAALGAGLISLLVATLVPGTATPAPAAADLAGRALARTGTLVMTIKTPDGVPGVVALKSDGRKRLLTKKPVGERIRVKVTLPVGRWTVAPQQVVHDSAVFTGGSSSNRVRVRAGRQSSVAVTYRRAPSVTDLRVARIDRTSLDLSWQSPSPDAEYAARMTNGTVPPASATAGTEVPLSGTTANATGLSAASEYAFSVFAREPGTSKWWGPVSTTVTTPSVDLGGETVAAVTNPATVMVTDPGTVAVSVADGTVRSTVPAGTVPIVGQPWVLPPSAALPSGFVGTVLRVATDGTSVVLAAGGLADAFDYLEIRVPDLSNIPTRTPSSDRRSRLSTAGVGVACSGSVEESIVVDPSFDPFGHFNATLTKYKILGKNVPVGMSFDTRFGVQVGVSADAQVTAGASCSLDLPPIVATIPAGPVPIVMSTEPVLNVSMYGEVGVQNVGFTASLGASVDGHLGLGGDDQVDGELIASAEPLNPTVESVSGGVSITAGVETSVGPGVGNPKAGAMVGITANLNALDASATTAGGPGCLELNAARSASIALEAKAWLGSWDFSRSVTVPGLDGSDAYTGSPWRLPAGCGGDAEYRIAEGTLDVSHSWSGGCSNEQGSCNDGPDYTSSMRFSETSSAHLRVAEPGPWGQQWDAYRAYLTAPMTFTSWDFDAETRWQQSGYGCSWSDTWQTVGPMEFGGAYWETATSVLPGPDLALDADLNDYYHQAWSDEWTSGWWGSLGAWDTDHSNGFPRINTRDTWSHGGECEGSGNYDYEQTMEYLTPGLWWAWPEEARRSSSQVTSTPLEGCTPEACRWQVDGTDTYQYRSTYENYGYQGSGTATVTWSYVIERRPPAAPEPG